MNHKSDTKSYIKASNDTKLGVKTTTRTTTNPREPAFYCRYRERNNNPQTWNNTKTERTLLTPIAKCFSAKPT